MDETNHDGDRTRNSPTLNTDKDEGGHPYTDPMDDACRDASCKNSVHAPRGEPYRGAAHASGAETSQVSAYSHRDEPLQLDARYHNSDTSRGGILDDKEYGTKDSVTFDNRRREVLFDYSIAAQMLARTDWARRPGSERKVDGIS